MFSSKSFFALIPARSGSKRLPRKNILPLCGRPLIAWTIEAALASKYIDTVCVSTDDDVIVGLARSLRAEAPFRRPSSLATDDASSASVMLHALEYYAKNLYKSFDYVILLQPTSPLRTADDIDKAIEYLFSSGALALVSVCPEAHSPFLCMTLQRNFSLTDFIEKYEKLPPPEKKQTFYRINGAVYICQSETFLREKSFFPHTGTFAYVMPETRSVDIDTEIDFIIAEALLKKNWAFSPRRP